VLGNLTEAGHLGRKSGQGFYMHAKRAGKPQVAPGLNALQIQQDVANLDREALQQRMTLLIINEAARCLEESVVTTPADVDFGMVMGTGFAPFRGGPLRLADTLGLAKVVERMQHLQALGETHFEPCALLMERAREGKSFY